MCGRIHQSSPRRAAQWLQATFDEAWAGSFNLAPTMPLLAVRSIAAGGREAALLSWGLVPRWSDDPKKGVRPINARAETVATTPLFREAFRHRRCVAPIDGFYEWRREGGKTGQRFHIHAADGGPLALAAVWDRWEREAPALETIAVLTTAPNATMAAIHQRMPVLLDADGIAQWLAGSVPKPAALARLFAPTPDAWIAADPVSSWGNSVRHDGPQCLAP